MKSRNSWMRPAAGVSLLTLSLAGLSTAGVITVFSGLDDGAKASDPRPNSNAAAVKFDNLEGPFGVITFENKGVGPVMKPVDLGFKTTLVQIGTSGSKDFCDGICGTDAPPGVNGSYNTTTPGKNYLKTASRKRSQAIDTFSFADPISAFGFFYTGTWASDFWGDIKVRIFDADAFPEVVNLPLNNPVLAKNGIDMVAMGGVGFFGFSDSKPFSRVEIDVGFAKGREAFGIDDVRVQVKANPEPATISLAGIALVLIGALGRRRRSTAGSDLSDPRWRRCQ